MRPLVNQSSYASVPISEQGRCHSVEAILGHPPRSLKTAVSSFRECCCSEEFKTVDATHSLLSAETLIRAEAL